MGFRLKPHAVTGHLMPESDDPVCSACGHPIPGSQNAELLLHADTLKTADGAQVIDRPDILYFTWPKYSELAQQLVPQHLVTLASHPDPQHPRHAMLSLATMLREMAKDPAQRAYLEAHGLVVLSTHDDQDEAQTDATQHRIHQALLRAARFGHGERALRLLELMAQTEANGQQEQAG